MGLKPKDEVVEFVHRKFGMSREESTMYVKGLQALWYWTTVAVTYSFVMVSFGIVNMSTLQGKVAYMAGGMYDVIMGVIEYCRIVWPGKNREEKKNKQGGNKDG